jgi:hypothetical protein
MFETSDKVYHCGSCNEKIKHFVKCQGCERAYCSLECREKERTEEGHEILCREHLCEENTSWEVREDLDGGRRKVFALEDLQRGSFVMGAKGTILGKSELPLEENFRKSCSMNRSSSLIECSRANLFDHSCSPNASHMFDEKFGVVTVFAECDIKAGEEITLAYHPFTSPFQSFDSEDVSKISTEFRIVCLPDCACHAEKFAQAESARKLNNLCADFVRSGDFLNAFQTSKDLLKFYDVIDAGILTRARTRYL